MENKWTLGLRKTETTQSPIHAHTFKNEKKYRLMFRLLPRQRQVDLQDRQSQMSEIYKFIYKL